MSIGLNIKKKRNQKGVSQELLAEKLHISQATLSNIEADKSTPDVILQQQIANTLDTNIDELLNGKTIFVNNNNQQGRVGYAEIVNQLSEKIIELYENQLKEKNQEIAALKKALMTKV
ncbi:helix-turn-helix domain-containing protein [Algibacter pacificus]|uniref:helix-turn-helix domain-containing protein n=1 Tax=Algibacter pacificus TaxID=2599389 RepID=UPI0011C8C6E2|nr:helix-turn-helix transcriptional regulator [Algibacter pacificus]